MSVIGANSDIDLRAALVRDWPIAAPHIGPQSPSERHQNQVLWLATKSDRLALCCLNDKA